MACWVLNKSFLPRDVIKLVEYAISPVIIVLNESKIIPRNQIIPHFGFYRLFLFKFGSICINGSSSMTFPGDDPFKSAEIQVRLLTLILWNKLTLRIEPKLDRNDKNFKNSQNPTFQPKVVNSMFWNYCFENIIEFNWCRMILEWRSMIHVF